MCLLQNYIYCFNVAQADGTRIMILKVKLNLTTVYLFMTPLPLWQKKRHNTCARRGKRKPTYTVKYLVCYKNFLSQCQTHFYLLICVSLIKIFTNTSSDIMVYPMTTRASVKVTASKNRNNKFILDALNGLIDGRQFITTLIYSEEGKHCDIIIRRSFIKYHCLFLKLDACMHACRHM